LIALSIQQAERQRATPQATPPKKTTTRRGYSQGAAGAKRRTPVCFEYGNMMLRLMDIAGVLECVQITEREREQLQAVSEGSVLNSAH
jgi:hypothetical protein